jgi:hypothetical protein
MTRKALLLANPGEKDGGAYCDGVNKDMSNYQSLLLAPIGGWWRAEEIQVLTRPTVSQVRAALNELRQADYGFVAFAGHGYYSARSESTILVLAKGQEIDSGELRNGAPKHNAGRLTRK